MFETNTVPIVRSVNYVTILITRLLYDSIYILFDVRSLLQSDPDTLEAETS